VRIFSRLGVIIDFLIDALCGASLNRTASTDRYDLLPSTTSGSLKLVLHEEAFLCQIPLSRRQVDVDQVTAFQIQLLPVSSGMPAVGLVLFFSSPPINTARNSSAERLAGEIS